MRRQHHRQPLGPGLVIAVVVDRDAHRDAGIVDDDIEPAEMRGDVVDDGVDVVAVGDVERPGFCGLPPLAAISAATACVASALIVGDGDVGAFGGEHPRGGAAHAAGGAGDENGQTLDRAAELFEFGHDDARGMMCALQD